MTDSSIGSKTGINYSKLGKNTIGSIYDACFILINPNFLDTLSDRHFSNGLAEVIKYSLLTNEGNLFEELYQNCLKTIRNDKKLIDYIIKTSVKIKMSYVKKDKNDKGIRNALNLGHTIGHALEFSSNFNYLHGECVAFGLIKEAEIACKLGLLDFFIIIQIKILLKNYNLYLEEIPLDINFENFIRFMKKDKKNSSFNKISFFFIKKIGSHYDKTFQIEESVVRNELCNKTFLNYINNEKNSHLVNLPGSKSISLRILTIISLTKGKIYCLENFLYCDDTLFMLDALKKLNLIIIHEENQNSLVMEGNFYENSKIENLIEIDVGNSGLTCRFLISLAFLIQIKVRLFSKNERMSNKRPLKDLLDFFSNNSVYFFILLRIKLILILFYLFKNFKSKIIYENLPYHLPLTIIGEKFNGGECIINANESSQFVSSVLLIAPYAKNCSVILKIQKELTSANYVFMTINIMKKFGVNVEISKNLEGNFEFIIPQQKFYSEEKNIFIESDASTFSYDVAQIVLNQGSSVKIRNFQENIQGEAIFPKEIIKNLNVKVNVENDFLSISRDLNSTLKFPKLINMSECTDSFISLSIILSQVN